MWQKCPICLGTGIDKSNVTFNKKNKYPTCDGKKVINTITGNSPNIYEKNISEDRINFMKEYIQKLLEKGKIKY